eukprot:CAMPEP_0117599610 /NCGR_PEP_ID=MMETSP0784-20121206/76044_1 /TAXON_ID=39447 /ORGANISM="" /LENGTH=100 /DNA_ID=CAMNT_0005402183 /DNA_START=157 /DNA_END=456 /DNA_ORIENTATION=+
MEEHLLERVAAPLASPENAFADSDNGPDDGGDAIQDSEATLFATVFFLGLLLPRLSVFGHRRAPQASACGRPKTNGGANMEWLNPIVLPRLGMRRHLRQN